MIDTLHNILVGVDGSEGAERALRWSTSRALETGATILAVYILTYTQELMRDLPPSGFGQWREALDHHLHHEWTETARKAGVPLKCLFVENTNPVVGLLSVAEVQHADLVVVGAQGHGGVTDRLLGSTSYKLTHRAQQPVVVVPVDWAPQPRSTVP